LQVAGILPLRTAFIIASLKALSTAQSSSRPIFGIVDQKPTRLNKVASGRRHFEERVMKLNSRLLISELCAAAATALVSAIVIAGCASGERTGKFWDKGDINSSDAYVAAEMARDQSIAAKDHAASTSGKVAFTSGTQDGTTGHVSVGDFSGPPAAPPAVSAPAVSAGKSDVGSAAARGAQNAGAAVGSAEIAGTAAGGSIVAPYVQKRAASGPLDNNCHDGEILKPKTVSARQLDPFAATDAEPFLAPAKVAQRPAPPATALVNSAATAPPATQASTAHPTLPSGNAFAETDVAQTPVVSTKASTNPVPMELVPSEQPSAPVTPSTAPASAATVGGFDPSTPPPIPTGATSTLGPPPAPPQPAPERIATVMPAPPAFVPPKSVTVTAPARPPSGIRLGDENLNDDQQSAARPEEKQVVEPATTEPAPETHPSAAATPYEADTHHEVDTHSCVTSPPPPVGNPASVPAPPPSSPVQDIWEGTKASKPETPSIGQSAPVAAPVHVAALVPASTEPSRAQQASTTPAAVPLVAIPQRVAPPPATPTKATAARESVAASKIIEQSKDDGGPVPMICDSASVHGRYTGYDSPPPAPAPNPFDAAPASSPVPATKKVNKSIEGKSTSFWDDAFGSPALKHTVSTADFSVPVPPGPLEDDCQSIGIKGASTPSAALAATRSAREAGSSRSHAWFVIGMVAGLALSAVVWRRWRDHSDPPSEPQLD
jgi:hypothetical protein